MSDATIRCSVCGKRFAPDQVQVQAEGDAICHTCALGAAAAWSAWQEASQERLSRLARWREWFRRKPLLAWSVTGAVVLLAVGGITLLVTSVRSSPPARAMDDGYAAAAVQLSDLINQGNDLQRRARFDEALDRFRHAREIAQRYSNTRPELVPKIATLDQSIHALEQVTSRTSATPESVFDNSNASSARPAATTAPARP